MSEFLQRTAHPESTVQILLVEDNPGDAHLVQASLNRSQKNLFEIEWAKDFEDARRVLKNQTYDVIISDLSLPDSDLDNPLALVASLVKISNKTPCIILSGNENEELAVRALQNGAQDYIVKDQMQSGHLKRAVFYAMERRNLQLDLEKQAEDLKRMNAALLEAKKEADEANEAKSSFLASMSHELRTPLNSMLILSQMLSENEEENLTESQLQSTHAIYSAGGELLNLINDILDLSKVEAGEMTVHQESVRIDSIVKDLESQLNPVVKNKGLQLKVQMEGELPSQIFTDEHRMKQVLKNLLSNAIKFTPKGAVTLRIHIPDTAIEGQNLCFRPHESIAFSIIDEGAGIPKEKCDLIFERYKQAETTTTKKFGGTGLGLAISKKLSALLCGELTLKSEVGKGSCFTLYLPLFDEEGSLLAEDTKESAVMPIANSEKSLSKATQRNILIVDDDVITYKALSVLFKAKGFAVEGAGSGAKAKALLNEKSFDCLIVDLGLEDISGIELLKQLKQELTCFPPAILYTASDFDMEKREEYRDLVKSFVIKGVNSPMKLIEDVMYLLSSSENEQAAPKGFSPVAPQPDDKGQSWGKHVLLIDDDDRNTFALSRVLRSKGFQVDIGVTGEEALEKLVSGQSYDVVLMDVMMPVMDGYEAMRRIRSNKDYDDLPLIALTAKAMVEDRDKCIAAGADDYLAKPIDIEALFKKLNQWFSKDKSMIS